MNFEKSDAKEQAQTIGMTMKHFVAVSNAADEMKMDIENIFTNMGE